MTFSDPVSALEELSLQKPEIIVSDIRMPGMDGFEFKEAVDRMIPDGGIPFIFLSSLHQPAHLIRGLDLGAIDYLTKPIDPMVLRAKIRSLVRRKAINRPVGRSFRGDLGRFPFIKVMQFCESEGLTGLVHFESGELAISIPFRAGQIDMDGIPEADEILEKLYDLQEGEFRIEPGEPDFSSLAEVEIQPERSSRPPEERPMGKLSGLKLLNRLFQIQTEMNHIPEERILTIVVLDGNLVYKKAAPVKPEWSVQEIQERMEAQHCEVEAQIKLKAETLLEKKKTESESESAPESEGHEFYELFEKGWEAFRKQDFPKALKLWEAAEKLKPDDRTLKVNLTIVRGKMKGA